MAKTKQITCTKMPRAYVPVVEGDALDAYNLRDHVEIVERPHPGSDDTPVLVDAGCGAKVDVPTDVIWDINTQDDKVVERHLAIGCPYCGSTADHLSEAVAGVPVAQYLSEQRDDVLIRKLGADFDVKWPERAKDSLYRGISGAADIGYSNFTEGAVALAAATAKSIIGLKSHANFSQSWTHIEIGFDGVTAAAVPVLCEPMYATWATNAPGTNSTSTTIRQEYGRVVAAGSTAGKTWTVEPTVLTQMSEELLLTPNGGTIVYDFPLGKEPDCALAEGFVIRCTAPAIVNVRATMKWRRA